MNALRFRVLQKLCTLVLVLLASGVLRAEPGAAVETYEQLIQDVDGLLRAKANPGTLERLTAARKLLRFPHRPDLDDGQWIDLHVVLAEIERRLHPRPELKGRLPAAKEYREGLPTAVQIAGCDDPLLLLDAASRIHAHRLPAGVRPPGRASRAGYRDASRELTRIATAARSLLPSEDPVLEAAAGILVEKAEDLAFTLHCAAAARVAAGRERFEWLLKHRHRIRHDLSSAGEIGKRERARALAALERIARGHGDGKTWQELTEEAKQDRFANDLEMLEYCRATSREALALARDSGLITVPESARYLEVRHSSDRPGIPYACYGRGKLDEKGIYRGTAYYVRMPSGLDEDGKARWLGDRSRAWLRAVCAHEGVPGHHLQFAVEASSVKSPYRHYGYNSLYVEGWGLYSETLVERMGYFDKPFERLAWQRMKLWRAVRVIIDVGLHGGTMTPGEAVRMLTDEVLLDRDSAELEVFRYLVSPTQALSYTLGYRRIVETRRAWVARFGMEREREFHNRLLSFGVVPLDLAAAVLLGKRDAYDRAERAR